MSLIQIGILILVGVSTLVVLALGTIGVIFLVKRLRASTPQPTPAAVAATPTTPATGPAAAPAPTAPAAPAPGPAPAAPAPDSPVLHNELQAFRNEVSGAIIQEIRSLLERQSKHSKWALLWTALVLILILGTGILMTWIAGRSRMVALDHRAVAAGYTDTKVAEICPALTSRTRHIECLLERTSSSLGEAAQALDGLNVNPLLLPDGSQYGSFGNLQELLVRLAESSATPADPTFEVLIEGAELRSAQADKNGCWVLERDFDGVVYYLLGRWNDSSKSWMPCK